MTSTLPRAMSATIDRMTEIVLAASPIVMPKDSLTTQKAEPIN
jgi:hypothetical protein